MVNSPNVWDSNLNPLKGQGYPGQTSSALGYGSGGGAAGAPSYQTNQARSIFKIAENNFQPHYNVRNNQSPGYH